jgi:hypothetical protein
MHLHPIHLRIARATEARAPLLPLHRPQAPQLARWLENLLYRYTKAGRF